MKRYLFPFIFLFVSSFTFSQIKQDSTISSNKRKNNFHITDNALYGYCGVGGGASNSIKHDYDVPELSLLLGCTYQFNANIISAEYIPIIGIVGKTNTTRYYFDGQCFSLMYGRCLYSQHDVLNDNFLVSLAAGPSYLNIELGRHQNGSNFYYENDKQFALLVNAKAFFLGEKRGVGLNYSIAIDRKINLLHVFTINFVMVEW